VDVADADAVDADTAEEESPADRDADA